MGDNRAWTAFKGTVAGLVVTGVFFSADMMLPEPWGDYFLFAAMAVVNITAGILVFKAAGQKKEAAEGSRMAIPQETKS